jgi:hypothetical protein
MERRRASPCRGPLQKMVLLGSEKGTGARVTCWRPERSPGVMIPANVMPAMDGGVGIGCRRGLTNPATARAVREQKDRSCTGRTTERGTETGLNDRRKPVTKLWHGSVPRPISFAKAKGSGDVHGHAAGRKRSRERKAVSIREGRQNAAIAWAERHHPAAARSRNRASSAPARPPPRPRRRHGSAG